MDELYLSWLAGFIDADGSFTIGVRERSRADGSVNLTFHPVINIRQKASVNGVGLIEEIAKNIGCGRIYVGTRNDGTSSATWQTTSIGEVITVGSMVYKHLRLKGPQARRALRCAYLILEAVDGYNHNADLLWELYSLYRSINPDGNWADRKKELSLKDIEKIATANGKRKISKLRVAHDGLNALPEDVLREVIS